MEEQERLLKDLINQDKNAQKLLYDKYASKLLAICARYTPDISSAEDILQEVFLKIFSSIHEFAASGSFEGWLKRIAINTAINNYHKNLKHRYFLDISQAYDIADQEPITLDKKYSVEDLMKVINTLPQGYKMVFNLYAVEGYKHKEIAEMLQIDVNTSKSQFLRAKRIILEKLRSIK